MPEEGIELPPELPPEQLQAVIEKFTDGARKLGLYTQAVAVNVDQHEHSHEHEEPELHDPRHMLVAQFTIGDQAFSKRVQDPESDQIDTEFKKIAGNAVTDDVERIRRQYLEGKDDGSEKA